MRLVRFISYKIFGTGNYFKVMLQFRKILFLFSANEYFKYKNGEKLYFYYKIISINMKFVKINIPLHGFESSPLFFFGHFSVYLKKKNYESYCTKIKIKKNDSTSYYR